MIERPLLKYAFIVIGAYAGYGGYIKVNRWFQ